MPIYVEYGAADLGICGLDVLREGGRSVYEPLLPPFGYCRLSLAGPADRPDIPLRYDSQPRVATTFPRLTADFFRTRGINAEIIALKGSVELGPLVGLADLIVDLVDTGNTLRANGLIEPCALSCTAKPSSSPIAQPTGSRPKPSSTQSTRCAPPSTAIRVSTSPHDRHHQIHSHPGS